MGRMQTVFLLCGWSSHAKAHPAEYQCRFTHTHTHAFAISVAHTHTSPSTSDQISNSSIRHTNADTPKQTRTCKTHIQRYEGIYTHKSRDLKDKTYTHTETQFNKRQKRTIIITHSHTHTHPWTEAVTHTVSQSHIPPRTVYTAEKTDWVCLFVGSSLHVCLLCFSQWKTSILRIIKWLKRALLICRVCVSPVCIYVLVSVSIICVNMCLNGCLDAYVNAQAGGCLGMFWNILDRQAQKPTWLVVFRWRQVPPFNLSCHPTIRHDFL